MKIPQDVIAKAEQLYTYFNNSISRKLTLDIKSVGNRDIDDYVKDCVRKVCNEMIIEHDKSGETGRTKFWYAVRKQIEDEY